MINNNYSIKSPLAKDELDLIHKNTLDILENDGIKIDNEKALKIFKDHNIKTKGKKVFLTEDIIEKCLSNIPESFTLKARNKDNNVQVGGDNSVLGPGQGAPFIYENNQKEYGTYKDYIKLIKLFHQNPYIDLIGGEITPGTDIEENIRNKKKFYASLKYSDKALIGTGSGKKTEDCLQMGEKIFGNNNFKDNYHILKSIGVSSPLKYDKTPLETLLNWTSYNQPIALYSQILAGMSGPATLAGTLTLQNAEILAGAVLIQLINPGNPVIYNSYSSVADMNSGEITVGNAQYGKIIGATAQLSNYYGLPSMVGGGLTDADISGSQSGMEAMLNMFTAVASGIDIILFAAGAIKDYMGISFEKYVSDLEVLKNLNNYQSQIKVNKNTIARQAISDTGSEGNYLTHPHTLKQLENKEQLGEQNQINDDWEQEIKKILNDYQKPELDSEIEEKLLEFI